MSSNQPSLVKFVSDSGVAVLLDLPRKWLTGHKMLSEVLARALSVPHSHLLHPVLATLSLLAFTAVQITQMMKRGRAHRVHIRLRYVTFPMNPLWTTYFKNNLQFHSSNYSGQSEDTPALSCPCIMSVGTGTGLPRVGVFGVRLHPRVVLKESRMWKIGRITYPSDPTRTRVTHVTIMTAKWHSTPTFALTFLTICLLSDYFTRSEHRDQIMGIIGLKLLFTRVWVADNAVKTTKLFSLISRVEMKFWMRKTLSR